MCSLRQGSWAGNVLVLHNDGRTSAIWTATPRYSASAARVTMGGASCRAFARARSVCPAREFAGERDRHLFRRCLWTEYVPLAEAYRDHGEAERRAQPQTVSPR